MDLDAVTADARGFLANVGMEGMARPPVFATTTPANLFAASASTTVEHATPMAPSEPIFAPKSPFMGARMQSGSDVNNGNVGVQNSPHLYYGGRGQQQQFRGGYGSRGRGRIFQGRGGRGLRGPTGPIRRSASADVIRRDVPFPSAPMEGQRLISST